MIRHDIDDRGVATVTLADPDRRNALRIELSRALAAAMDAVMAGGARAVVLAAEPPVFCAGGSLDDLITPRVPLEETYAGFLAVARCPVPTIAAVGGACVGAGVNLPLACDVIVTTAKAKFDPRWLDVGIHPGGGHFWRLHERIGRQAAAATVLCGETIGGEDAVRLGLAWKCVADDDLLPAALALAARAAGRDPELVRRAKATLDASRSIGDSESAIALELAVQRWSMERPGFREGVEQLRDQLAARARSSEPKEGRG